MADYRQGEAANGVVLRIWRGKTTIFYECGKLCRASLEHRDAESSITFAKSIMLGVPASYFFFMPFFFAERMQLGFWQSYISGLVLLIVAFFVHRTIMHFIS
tara:strand:+ start:1010 stop:1315 length:306 start_codon:yes stop_codon:yes gene_type:complete